MVDASPAPAPASEAAAPPVPVVSALPDPQAPMSAMREPPIFAEVDKAGRPGITDLPDPKAVESKPEPVAETKTEDKPVETATDTTPTEAPPEKMAPKQLRDAYEKLKNELKEIKAKSATAPVNITEAAEFKELKAKVEAKEQEAAKIRAEADELSKKLQYVDAEQDPKFQKEFREPYVNAWREAMATLSQYGITTEDGQVRKATIEDFTAIVSEPDAEKALQVAEEIFKNPTKANRALDLREKVIAASNRLDQAKNKLLTEGAEVAKQRTAAQQEAQKVQRDMWATEIKSWSEKNAELLTPADGDEKAKELIEIGAKAADMAFGDTSHLSPQQRAKLYAETRNRAATYGHVVHKLGAATKQIETLKAELAKFKGSTPGKGTVAADAPKSFTTMADRIDALVASR